MSPVKCFVYFWVQYLFPCNSLFYGYRLDEYHRNSRPHMRAAYFAYLQNTPGSRQAIYDCMKEIVGKKKDKEQTPQAVA